MKKGPTSRFIKVKCNKCKNEQIIFGKPSTEIKCLVCGKVLSKNKGGKAEIDGQILEVLS